MFGLKHADAAKLSELIAELTRSQPPAEDPRTTYPFTGPPPYCTVENVTHVSSCALRKLLEFDDEFIWGDNLIFNTKSDAL